MKVLVIGSGGREHAICHALSKSPLCEKLYCAPGNAGIAAVAECLPIESDKISEIVSWATTHEINFVIVGPEIPLTLGLVDALTAQGIPSFGPKKQAAELENSKRFTKDLCKRAGIPTAQYQSFKETKAAQIYIKEHSLPIVIKASGLAAGKGVTIARTTEEAFTAIDEAMTEQKFGEAGQEIVIEEFLEGEEVSFFVLSDGTTARFFATAQDHKTAFDGDKGPNTGGMGAYSPSPIINEALQERIMHEIIDPTIREMKKMGCPFSGILYAGLMMTKTGPKLIEYNVRFGDPEAEVMLPRLKSDLLALLYTCSQGMLEGVTIEWKDEVALGVIMAAKGYPGAYEKGTVIHGLERAGAIPHTVIFHAGTKQNAAGEIVANGGRVLCITALASTLTEAQKRAYEAIDCIEWQGGFCRRDIGWRALTKNKAA